MSRLRIAVLAGGKSSEHEVSRSSGAGVLAGLDADRYDVTPVEISRDGRWSSGGHPVALAVDADGAAILASLNGSVARPLDVVFPVLHGPFGEDGAVQGVCDTIGVACVGSGVAASAMAMDKAVCKDLMRQAGIPTCDGVLVRAGDWASDSGAVHRRVMDEIGVTCFVKPARLGSSVGISRVTDEAQLDVAITLALSHDPRVLVERAVVGAEVEVGILGNDEVEASPVGQILYDAEWYDYETKYEPGRMQLAVPADIPTEVAARVQTLGRDAFRALGCRGLARIDFFATPAGEVLISEINTIPGFTPTSVYAKLFEAGGIAYGDLLDRLVALALADFADRARYRS